MKKLNESYWTYRCEAPPSFQEAKEMGAIPKIESEAAWISLSPGMRREIVRQFEKRSKSNV